MGRDSNPRYLAVHTLSRRAQSTALAPIRNERETLKRQCHSFNLFSGRLDLPTIIVFARKRSGNFLCRSPHRSSAAADERCGLRRLECQNQRIQLRLEFGLAFLDYFQSQLVSVKLDCRVMDVPFDFGQLSLGLAEGPLQLGLSAF
jgi:hypothetical protein